MAKSQHVPADVKKQILDRIKQGGASIKQVAEEHGISDRTVYGWLSKGAVSAPSWLELNRLKRENAALKELIRTCMKLTKSKLAKQAGCSRSSLYYRKKQPLKDWRLKVKIEDALHDHPGYGHKSLADHLKIGKDKILRVMKLFGIKPYRRRSKKRWKKAGKP